MKPTKADKVVGLLLFLFFAGVAVSLMYDNPVLMLIVGVLTGFYILFRMMFFRRLP